MKRNNLLEALTDNIVVDPGKCTFCGECANVCVLDNLRMKLAPCRAACPLGVNCQGYVQLINRGEDEKAFEVLTQTLPFPQVLARVCPAPCEDACHHKVQTGQAVAIKALKRYLAEQGGDVTRSDAPAPRNGGGAVAIVGSGPAGMMAACDLARAGHRVTMFESESEPGGMLRWAIPAFKLPADTLAQEFDLLAHMGVTIVCGVRIGTDRTLNQIRSEFDAVIVAAGCAAHATLGIQGEDLAGVFYGRPFLKDVRADRAPDLSGKVVVIGGGNVAVDTAQTAVRLGADSVVVVSLEVGDEMPAFAESLAAAAAEGVVFEPSWGPLWIAGENGRVVGVELQRCLSAFDNDGNFDPKFDACVTRNLQADTVIVAIGQGRDSSCLAGSCLADEATAVDPVTLASSEENIFVAGDFLTGPSSVVAAMASGKRAAESVDRYVRGEHLSYGRSYAGPVELDFEIDTSLGSDLDRVEPSVRPCRGAGDFSETALPLDETSARQEASRCYSCGSPFGKYRTCWFCLPCEVECPEQAIWVDIPYLLR